MTPHNKANLGDIAKTVLMPGDPLRAEYIANTYLTDVVRFNDVRNMFGYTGNYKGKRVSVMASGMGIPSITIYSYELYKFYGVENIIRVGSCGSYSKDLKLYSCLLVDDAYSESSFAKTANITDSNILPSSNNINKALMGAAKNLNIELKNGRIHSSDVFYGKNDYKIVKNNYNCLAVEMESFGLFANAMLLNKNASCILTVSDNLESNEAISSIDRQKSFNDMIKISLEAAINL